MGAAAEEGVTRVAGKDQTLLHAATVDFKTSPFRGDKAGLIYLKVVPTVLDFGAVSYTFIRDDQDREYFRHTSVWKDKADFEQWWFSKQMQELRDEMMGLHDLPLFPHWYTVIEQS